MRLRATTLQAITPAPPGAGPDVPLAVPYCTQRPFLNLCWAACCQMVFAYYGRPVQLCDITAAVFGVPCCNEPTACDHGAWPETVYSNPQWNFQWQRMEQAFLLGNVIFEITANRPIETYYAWNGGGAHVALISGYYSNQDIQVLDPWYGPGRLSYQYVLAGYGQGAWTKTYFHLEP